MYMGVENNNLISIQHHSHQNAASSNAIDNEEIWGSLDGFYGNYNISYILILLQNVTHEVTT